LCPRSNSSSVDPDKSTILFGFTGIVASPLACFTTKPVGTANTYKDKIQNHLTDKLDGVKAVGWYWAPKVDLETVGATFSS
jgi:hypothetical protein